MDDNHLNEKFLPMTSVSSGDVQIVKEDIIVFPSKSLM